MKGNEYFDTWSSVSKRSSKHTSYFDVYSRYFDLLKSRDEVRILEIGVSTGGSLEATAKYFEEHQNFEVVGLELNSEVNSFEWDSNNISILIGDSEDEQTFETLLRRYGKFDLIIDDGGHTNLQQITSLLAAESLLKPHGFLIVEDVQCSYLAEFDNPSKFSFISVTKNIIDGMHARSSLVNGSEIKLNINSISIHTGMVIFEFDQGIKDFEYKQILNGVESSGLTDFRFKDVTFFNKVIKNRFSKEFIGYLQSFPVIHKIIKTITVSLKQNLKERKLIKQKYRSIFK